MFSFVEEYTSRKRTKQAFAKRPTIRRRKTGFEWSRGVEIGGGKRWWVIRPTIGINIFEWERSNLWRLSINFAGLFISPNCFWIRNETHTAFTWRPNDILIRNEISIRDFNRKVREILGRSRDLENVIKYSEQPRTVSLTAPDCFFNISLTLIHWRKHRLPIYVVIRVQISAQRLWIN